LGELGDASIKKSIIDRGLQEIGNEFIAFKNRQIMKKINFTSTLNRRKQQVKSNLANVLKKTQVGRRDGKLVLKDTLINKPKVVLDDDESLSRDSDSNIKAALDKK